MILGIDLGGTKVAFALFNHADDSSAGNNCLSLQHQRRLATPVGYQAILDLLAAVIASFREEYSKIQAIGIGVPGALSMPSRRIKNANSTWLICKDLGADLEARVGLPVTLANDANAFALAESQGADEALFGVILGTGVGGGLVLNGQIVEGANGVAGEWGHLVLADDALVEGLVPNPMRACYCGNRGCIETLLSGPGMVVDLLVAIADQPALLQDAAQTLLGDDAETLSDEGLSLAIDQGRLNPEQATLANDCLKDSTGFAAVAFLERSAKRVESMAALVPAREHAGDDKARFALTRLLEAESPAVIAAVEEAKSRYFARIQAALKTIVQVADPEIVLGGGVSNLPGLVEALEAGLPKVIFNATGDAASFDTPKVKVRLSRYGDDAGVRGAAMLALSSWSKSTR